MHGGKTIITTKCLIGTESNIYDGTFCKFVGNNLKTGFSRKQSTAIWCLVLLKNPSG